VSSSQPGSGLCQQSLQNVFDRDAAGKHAMRLSYAIVALLAVHVTAHGADAADALAKLDTNGNHIVEEAEAQAGGRKLFADLDKNGDGLLQPEELNGSARRF
jgi:hypothetical protein